MNRQAWLVPAAVALTAGLMFVSAQDEGSGRNRRLPSGKSQTEEILKADHQKSLRDAAELAKLSEELRAELEKSDYHVLSVGTIKKTEEIERLAKRIRSRLRRF